MAVVAVYCMAGKFGGGKFGEFGESSMIRQTKTIQISTYILITYWLMYYFAKLSFTKCSKRINLPNLPTIQYLNACALSHLSWLQLYCWSRYRKQTGH